MPRIFARSGARDERPGCSQEVPGHGGKVGPSHLLQCLHVSFLSSEHCPGLGRGFSVLHQTSKVNSDSVPD